MLKKTDDMRERVGSWGKSDSQRAGEEAWDLYATPAEREFYSQYVERWLDEEPRRRVYSQSEPPGQREHTKKLLAVSFWLQAKVVLRQREDDARHMEAWGVE